MLRGVGGVSSEKRTPKQHRETHHHPKTHLLTSASADLMNATEFEMDMGRSIEERELDLMMESTVDPGGIKRTREAAFMDPAVDSSDLIPIKQRKPDFSPKEDSLSFHHLFDKSSPSSYISRLSPSQEHPLTASSSQRFSSSQDPSTPYRHITLLLNPIDTSFQHQSPKLYDFPS